MIDAGSMRPLNPAEVQAASSLSSAQGVPATGGSPGGVLLIFAESSDANHQELCNLAPSTGGSPAGNLGKISTSCTPGVAWT